jgi:hypothetical protein
MSRHVSVVMPDELFAKMEAARGRESKSSFVNFILKKHFEGQPAQQETGE